VKRFTFFPQAADFLSKVEKNTPIGRKSLAFVAGAHPTLVEYKPQIGRKSSSTKTSTNLSIFGPKTAREL